MTLADLGADVIKVENPEGGDDTRSYRPPEAGGESAYFLSCNRSKRSIAIDFTRAEGQDIVRDLASKADVLVENYRMGTLDRYGLDHASLMALNPRLIYCSITGYGRESPLADRAGYDSVIQAEGGLMSVTGAKDAATVKVGVSIADILSGMNSTQAVLAALYARERTGRGQWIDISLLDGIVSVLANLGAGYFADGRTPRRWGTAHPNLVPCQAFPVADGELVLVIGNDRQFRTLVKAMDLGELAADLRFATNKQRVHNREALVTILSARFSTGTREHWLKSFHAVGLPAGAIRDVREVLESPEVTARDMVLTLDHPTAGPVRVVGSPLKLKGTPVRRAFAPPLLGEHTREVLAGDLDYDDARIADLESRTIVMQYRHD